MEETKTSNEWIERDKIEKKEPPKELTKENVIYWSEHWKKLMGCEEGKGIQTKAFRFLKENCIMDKEDNFYYDKEKKEFSCLPLKGYNKTTYHIVSKEREFSCSCQYNQTYHKMCSHILSLYLALKIKHWNKWKQKELNTSEII